MDLDKAVQAHVAWKMKLSGYFKNPDQSLKASVVGADNQCELGKWLHGEGKQYASHPEYKKLIEEHAKFHREAANLINKADRGEKVTDEIAFGSNSPYSHVSNTVTQSILSLKRKIGVKAA
jgi:hypothetical protein